MVSNFYLFPLLLFQIKNIVKLIRKSRIPVALLMGWLVLSSWGYKGHEIIGENFALSMNDEMNQFESWVPVLANHSGDADKRKSWDSSEGIKHYIDIDNYPEFLENGKIAQDINELIATHGRDFVSKQGILPWATVRAYDTLVVCFEKKDFDRAALIAADLSHYVGDGHMPLHITANYDGQLSGNDGIHSRYESAMISSHENELVYEGSPVTKIDNVEQYVFNYIYESHSFMDSILHADDYARSATASTKSTAYTDTLWARTRDLTISQFQKSSHALAALIYTAWLEAGAPSFNDHTFSEELIAFKTMLNAVYYRDSVLMVEFGLNEPSEISCDVLETSGKKIISKEVGHFGKGLHHFQLNVGMPKGNYIFSFHYNQSKETRKFSVW